MTIVALIAVAGPAPGAESRPASQPTREAGAELSVFLITMGPGPLIYERFGHNALIIEDAAAGRAIAYNYGIFDFGDESVVDLARFILRFARGRMLYRVEAWHAGEMIRMYRAMDRRIVLQELDLSAGEKLALARFLDNNIRPENRDYPYDYYRNNCSTKVRDALDLAVGGQIRRQLTAVGDGTTYRFHARRHTENDPLMNAAIDYMQGHPVDVPLSEWEESFLPMEFMRHARSVRLDDGRPLVKREELLNEGRSNPLAPARPARWLWRYLAAGVCLGAAMAALGWLGAQRRWARWGFASLAVVWLGVTGLVGAFLALEWATSQHIVVSRNENLLQLGPWAFPLAALVVGVALRRRWAWPTAWALALGVAGLSAMGLLLKAVPGFDQPNGRFIALALPAHLGVLAAVWFLGTRQAPAAITPVKKSQR